MITIIIIIIIMTTGNDALGFCFLVLELAPPPVRTATHVAMHSFNRLGREKNYRFHCTCTSPC